MTGLSSSSVGELQGIGNAVPRWQDDAPSDRARASGWRRQGVRGSIEIASRASWECAGAGWKQRFILGHAGDARFAESRGVTSAQPWLQDMGQPVDAAMAPPEGGLCEATRRSQSPGAVEGVSARGNPRALPSALTEDAICGQPRTHQEASQKRRCGETRRFIRCAPKDRGFEATRSSIAGTAERCRTRGNSWTHRKAERDDAWSEQPVVHRDRGARDSGFWRLCFFSDFRPLLLENGCPRSLAFGDLGSHDSTPGAPPSALSS